MGDSYDLRLSHDGKKQLENQHRCFQLAQSATAVEDAAKQQTNWNHKTWEFCGVMLQFRKEHIILISKSISTLFESCHSAHLCKKSHEVAVPLNPKLLFINSLCPQWKNSSLGPPKTCSNVTQQGCQTCPKHWHHVFEERNDLINTLARSKYLSPSCLTSTKTV